MGDKLDIKILYVEDDGEVRNEMLYYLENKFTHVIGSINGKEGLEKFIETNPDIVITDLKMPEMSGIEMIEQIRNSGSQVPVIVLTAYEDHDSMEAIKQLKVNDYILKNFITNKFWETINQCLENCSKKS